MLDLTRSDDEVEKAPDHPAGAGAKRRRSSPSEDDVCEIVMVANADARRSSRASPAAESQIMGSEGFAIVGGAVGEVRGVAMAAWDLGAAVVGPP